MGTENSSKDETEFAHERVMDRVRNSFAPGFLNRLSAIVMFNSLGTDQLEKVVRKTMAGVKRRLASKGVKVELEKSGVRAILDASYDPSYGARPVERFLEGTVVTKLSRMLIGGELTSGTIVHIEAADKSTSTDSSSSSPVAKKPRNTTTIGTSDDLQYRVEHDAAYEA